LQSSHCWRRKFRRERYCRGLGNRSWPKELKKKRAVFAGAARNCSWFLPNVLQNVSRLAALYEDAAFVIAENDSDDETKSMLRSWLCQQSHGHLIDLDGLKLIEPRTQRIATARNACLDLILSGTYRDYDHLVMLDFDDVNASPISIEDFLAAVNFLEENPAAAGVFANQKFAYYDIRALRHANWCPDDCWKQLRAKPRWMPRAIAAILYVYRRQFSIPADGLPIRVRSAFGGLGVYQMSKILDCRYDGLDSEGVEVCGHVPFNQKICDHGGELYVYPKLLNQAPSEHVFTLHRSGGRRSLFVLEAVRLWQTTFPPWKRLERPFDTYGGGGSGKTPKDRERSVS